MTKKDEFKLTEGSRYKIISIGGRENPIESEGIFRGFASIGIDEGGIQLELSTHHDEMEGKIRIIPLHAILLIDVLDIKEDKKEEVKELNHYYS